MPIQSFKSTTRRLLGAALLAGGVIMGAGGVAQAGPYGDHDGYVDVRGGHGWSHHRHHRHHGWHHRRRHWDHGHGYGRRHLHQHRGHHHHGW